MLVWCRTHVSTLRPLIIVPGGLITSTGVVLAVLVLVFVVPGAVLVAIDVVACHNGSKTDKPPPGLQKPAPGPTGPPRDSLLAPPGQLLTVLEYTLVVK